MEKILHLLAFGTVHNKVLTHLNKLGVCNSLKNCSDFPFNVAFSVALSWCFELDQQTEFVPSQLYFYQSVWRTLKGMAVLGRRDFLILALP